MEFIIELDELLCYITLFILACIVFYVVGSVNTIKDDIKSLDYDNIKKENEELKRCIEIKRRNK